MSVISLTNQLTSSRKRESTGSFLMKKPSAHMKDYTQISTSQKIASGFLDKFGIYSLGEQQPINLELMIFTLPKKITAQNISLVDMINFGTIQKSIIQFQYHSIEELFLFYDERTKKRMQHMQENTSETNALISEIAIGMRQIKQTYMSSAFSEKKKTTFVDINETEDEKEDSSQSHVFSD